MEYIIFRGYTPVALNLVINASRLDLRSSPTEIYVTIGLGISVSVNEVYATIGIFIFVFENYGWIKSGWADTATDFKIIMQPLNVSRKFTL